MFPKFRFRGTSFQSTHGSQVDSHRWASSWHNSRQWWWWRRLLHLSEQLRAHVTIHCYGVAARSAAFIHSIQNVIRALGCPRGSSLSTATDKSTTGASSPRRRCLPFLFFSQGQLPSPTQSPVPHFPRREGLTSGHRELFPNSSARFQPSVPPEVFSLRTCV